MKKRGKQTSHEKTLKGGKQFLDLIIRYLVLVLVALPNLWIFYFLFTKLTIYPIYFLLNLFFDSSLNLNVIIISNCCPIEIINACVAGSAYYLLVILNLSTPKIKLKQRFIMLAGSFAAFLIVNILRIFVLSLIIISGSSWFNFTHKLFWYFGSVFFILGIWFGEVKLFKIKEIPFYSDIKFLYQNSLIKK